MGYDMYRVQTKALESDEGFAEAMRNGDYHRLNVWGMGEAREALHKVGVVREGPFPDGPADHEPATIDAWRIASAGDGPGIPVHKFCSNDGWVVTPLEVQSGIIYADQHHPGWRDDLPDHIREFVIWMEGSSAGFEVW